MLLRIKILITLIAGGLTYLLTIFAGQPVIWQLTMSVFVAGVVLVVQVLLETDTRLLDLKTQLRPDQLTRLVTAAASLDPADDLQRRFADHEITRVAELFEGLRNGWAIYEGEDRDWLLGLTACVTESIDATSMTTFDTPRGYVDEGQFWGGDLGQRYLDSQHRAIDRGVRIRRLFLLDDVPAANKDRIAELIEPHRKIGVETRILPTSSLDFLLQKNLVDFILFDRRISYELHAASTLSSEHRPVIASVTLVVENRRLDERRDRFDKMWASANEPYVQARRLPGS